MPVPFANAFATAGSAIGRVTNPISSRLGRRGTIIVRYVALVVLGLVVFAFALQATFPYERVKDKAIEALSGSYDVTIGGVDRGIVPGNVTFHDVTLRSRPSKPDEVAMVVVVKQIDVKMGLLALLGRNITANLDLKIGSEKDGYGHIEGSLTWPKFGKAGIDIALDGSDLPADAMPMQAALGLPMRGKVEFQVDLDLPVSKNKMGRTATDWSKAAGTLDLGCTGCTLGDGKAKLKPLLKNRSNQVMVGDGIEIGEIAISSLEAHAVFTAAVGDPDAHSSSYKPGKFELTKFELKSPDGELHVDYQMTMATTIDESIVSGCLRFKPNESLLKKEEGKKTYGAMSTTGAELRSDGLFHIKLSDRFKDMKRFNAECGKNAPTSKVGNGEDFSPHPTGRPMIQPTPPELHPGSATMPPPPPQQEPPPPPPPPLTGSAMMPTPYGSAGSAGSAVPEGAAAGAGRAEGHTEGRTEGHTEGSGSSVEAPRIP
ncbi:MAG: type II secretion system protein GspN [Kofleriaceae bacterium]